MGSTLYTYLGILLLCSAVLLVEVQASQIPRRRVPPRRRLSSWREGRPRLPSRIQAQRIERKDDQVNLQALARERLQSVGNVDEFISLLKTDQGRPVTSKDIFSEYLSEDGKRMVYTGGRMAEPDRCSLRNVTVQLTLGGSDSTEVFYPSCTTVERCGGCAMSPFLECVPVENTTQRISLTVVKARAPQPGSSYFVLDGLAPVVVEKHTDCQLNCTLTEDQCGPGKRLELKPCQCVCKRFTLCATPRLFNQDTCQCECPKMRTPCCPGGSTTCDLIFDSATCSCQKDNGQRRISSSQSITAGEDGLAKPAATTTTPKPVTAIVGTEIDFDTACAIVYCPPKTFKKVLVDGRCRCRPLQRFQYHQLRRLRGPRRESLSEKANKSNSWKSRSRKSKSKKAKTKKYRSRKRGRKTKKGNKKQ